MLTLMMGMVKEDGMAAGLAGKGAPDFEGYEKLLKNISGSRIPGIILNDHGENVSISALKSHMQYLDKTCNMYVKHAILVKLTTQLQQYMVFIINFKIK